MRKYIAIIIASLALFTGQAHAQRCLPKMQGIELRANLVDGMRLSGNNGGYSFGAALGKSSVSCPLKPSDSAPLC